jgi:SAM-dependent methyltransferase
MGTTPAGHADLFHQAFRGAPPRARVLIAGGADYGMLALAGAACRAAGVEAEFAMVDWCETPLRLARWYAERESLVLTTARRDLLDIGETASFDAACTQALLGHFLPIQRPRLLSSFYRALRPGGFLVMAQRLRPDAGDAPASFSGRQVDDFVSAVLAKARSVPGSGDARLAASARAYASRQVSWPVRSAEEIQALFENAGFRIAHLSSAPMAQEGGKASLNVPTIAGNASYARLIAVKP